MKKTYKMFLALVACLLCGMSANAERISLQEVPFCNWDGWTADAQSTGVAECAWVIGESTGQPYGHSSVIPFADLSNFTKLIVTVTDGTPRFLLNRDIDEGKANASESEAHLIDNTVSGWSDKYFSSTPGENEGETVYTVDLKQIVKDKGYAHLHAIKGANWQNVTVTEMVVERATSVQVGWTSIINNGNLEGDDASSFRSRIYPDTSMPVPESEILDEIGVDGSRGIKVAATAKAANPWDNQFFIYFNEPLLPDARYRISFDYKADAIASASTQAHAEPGNYIHYEMLGNVDFTDAWQTFTKEGTITADQSKPGENKAMQSIAFNLNELADANNYYFDNFKFEVYKYGTVAEFCDDAIKLDFGFDTNIPELVKAGGKPRIMFPDECVTVKVNGKEADIESVEGFADGRFYIFMDEEISKSATVQVTFTNPAEEAFHLVYTSGATVGQAVANFDGEATYNGEVAEADDAYAYIYETPTVVKADPEDGSFNLPNSIKDFKVAFDKPADCKAIVATLNGQAMTITPATGFAEEITMTRQGDGDLATGEYVINITKIYGESRLDDKIFGDTTYVVNVGKIEYDPTDVAKEILPISYFNECAAGSVPEGFILYADGETPEERIPGNNYGSGARMMDFGAGGDFTKGLYMRTWYLEYGITEGHELDFEAGKKYRTTFNSAMWTSGGPYMKFAIFNAAGEEVLSQVIENKPNLGEKRDAVNGSTKSQIDFTPEVAGKYTMQWIVAKDAQGTPTENAWANGVILANVKVMYVPNQVGMEETQLLNTALENAKKVRDANAGERYAGEDFTALDNAINKYEAEKDGYTAPSVYRDAAAELDKLAAAMNDHRKACDDYDTQVKKAIDVVRQNAEKKFAATELYAQLSEVVAKYHGASQWQNVADTIADPTAEDWQLFYEFDVLTDNDSLNNAIKELTDIANTTSLLFTEGESNCSDTGVKVLIERLRLGAEDLKGLGFAEDHGAVVAANNALTDDEELAETIKGLLTLKVYETLADPANKMFEAVVDTTTLESSTPTYDMTVFVKNPNIYKLSDKTDFTDEAVPGWTVPEGFSRPGLSCGWGAFRGTSQIAEDCMFQTWGGSYRVEQTIVDLPAGVYTIKIGFGERMQDDASSNMEESFVYAKLSDTPIVGDGGVEDRTLNFARTAECPGIGQSFPKANAVIENITVVDGYLTIGVNASQGSHTFFNDVRLLLAAPAAGFDYATAYQGAVEGVETASNQAATVRGIELYDLNGRRILTARQGMAIVKKYMSDGTVKVEKVIKK